MNLLAVDTSSKNISLSIFWKGKELINFNRKIAFGASHLITYIEKYFKEFSLDIRGIDALIIGAGPGSFTGLRISFSVIKALSMALNKPVVRVGSFDSIAYPFKDKYKKISVISDARRNQIYATSFISNKGGLKKKHKEKLVSLEEFVSENKDSFFLTYDSNIREKALVLCPDLKFHPKDTYPKAKNLLSLGQKAYLDKDFTPLEKLEPLYIYPKTCQIRNKK